MAGQIIGGVILVASALACAVSALFVLRDARIEQRNSLIEDAVNSTLAQDTEIEDPDARSATAAKLYAAGIEMSPLMWLSIRVIIAFLAYAFALAFTSSAIIAIIAVLAVIVGAQLYLAHRIKSRQILLEEQFGRACFQIASSVRTGTGVDRVIRSTAAFVDEPLKDEFIRVSAETRHDPDTAAALFRMAERTNDRDVAFLASMVDLNQRRGGKLADVIERLSVTVATRQEMRRLVRSESSSGRSAAKAVAVILAGIIAFQFATNPSTVTFYLSDPLGWVIGVLSIAVLAVGWIWMYRITNIKMD